MKVFSFLLVFFLVYGQICPAQEGSDADTVIPMNNPIGHWKITNCLPIYDLTVKGEPFIGWDPQIELVTPEDLQIFPYQDEEDENEKVLVLSLGKWVRMDTFDLNQACFVSS